MKMFVVCVDDDAVDRFEFQFILDDSVIQFWLLDTENSEE